MNCGLASITHFQANSETSHMEQEKEPYFFQPQGAYLAGKQALKVTSQNHEGWFNIENIITYRT